MNQNTCKTCKWWQWNNDLGFTTGSGEFIPWGTPLIRFVCGGTGQWKAADGMVDAEDYGGVLTGPDFGCIHYEETQQQLPQDHPGYAAQQVKLAARFGVADGSTQSVYKFNDIYRLGRVKEETVSDQIKRGVIPRRPDGSICSP